MSETNQHVVVHLSLHPNVSENLAEEIQNRVVAMMDDYCSCGGQPNVECNVEHIFAGRYELEPDQDIHIRVRDDIEHEGGSSGDYFGLFSR